MKQKRGKDEWFPIGDVFSGQDGPVKAICEAPPQALHHFTQVDQIEQLVGASEADPDRGFMARLMVLCSLPRPLEKPDGPALQHHDRADLQG